MKISTKGRYALRLLIDLAHQDSDRFVPLKEIAERQKISRKYLEQIILALSDGEILLASRGVHGGYRLAKRPEAYTVGEILRLTEGDLTPVFCASDAAQCERSNDCALLPIWQGLSRVIGDYLDSLTLADLLQQQTEIQPDLSLAMQGNDRKLSKKEIDS